MTVSPPVLHPEDAPAAASAPQGLPAREPSSGALDWALLLRHLAERAQTSMGRALCLAPPLAGTAEEARTVLGRVSELRRLREAMGADLPLRGLEDISEPLADAERGACLAPAALIEVRGVLQVLDGLRRSLAPHRELLASSGRIVDRIEPHSALRKELLAAFEGGEELSERTYPSLAELRRRKGRLHGQIRKALERISRDTASSVQDDNLAMRGDRYVLPVKASARSADMGIVHDTSRSGQTVFVEPHEVIPLNNSLKLVDAELRREEHRILTALSQAVGAEAGTIARALVQGAELDALSARAILADDLEATEPGVVDEAVLDLIDLRHPLLLLRGLDVISNSVSLGLEQRGLILSGPNSGGKTILLKGIGLSGLMVRAGMHLSVGKGSSIGLFQRLEVELGDKQSVSEDLSSFSSHLVGLRGILSALDEPGGRPALVLLDEVAVGTDPTQGAALACGVLECLVERDALVVVTTHYLQLKGMAARDERFVNGRVGIDEDGTPTYRLEVGVPGRSFAFDIAIRYGVPETVMERARLALDRRDMDVQALLRRLQEEIRRLHLERTRLHEARAEVDLRKRSLRVKIASLERKGMQLREEVTRTFEAEVDGWKKEIRDIIRELQQSGGGGMRAAQQAQKMLSQGLAGVRRRDSDLQAMVRPAEDESPLEVDEGPAFEIDKVKVGDRLTLLKMQKEATVETLPERGRLQVRVAGIRMWVRTHECGPPSAPAVPKAKGKTPAPRKRAAGPTISAEQLAEEPRAASLTLDIRGLRVDEALADLDDFLDRSALQDRRAVFVIHGHGTGALRKAIRQHLNKHQGIAFIQSGASHQGGDGITAVALR